ncbi:hypothetical protein ACFL2Q_15045 [Thermodesulfobacteriota bacterium]
MLNRIVLLSMCIIVLPGVASPQVPATGCSAFQAYGPISLSAYAGWLDHPTGLTLTTRLTNFNQEFVDVTPLKGAWLEVAVESFLPGRMGPGRVGFHVSGGMLVPSKLRGREEETFSGAESHYAMSGISWGSLQGLMSYNLSEHFQLLGGFRWDHFNTRVDFSGSPAFLDFKLNSYVPLIGVKLDRRFFGGVLIAGLLGWPGAVPGHMTQSYVGGPQIGAWDHIEQDLARGYMVEFFSEYRRTLFGSAAAGVFVRWNNLHVITGEDRYDWLISGSAGTGGQATESFDRRSWTIGGSLTLDFALPGFL